MPPKISYDYEVLLLITFVYFFIDNGSYFGFHSALPNFYSLFVETWRLMLLEFTYTYI